MSIVFRGVVHWNPMEGIRIQKTRSLFKKQPLGLEEFCVIPDSPKKERLHLLRANTILYLMVKIGMREIEVLRANVGDY